MSQEILVKLNSIDKQVVQNGTMILELKEDIKELKGDVVELKDGQAWMIERLSSMGALQYQLNDYGKRINTLEMKVSRAKS